MVTTAVKYWFFLQSMESLWRTLPYKIIFFTQWNVKADRSYKWFAWRGHLKIIISLLYFLRACQSNRLIYVSNFGFLICDQNYICSQSIHLQYRANTNFISRLCLAQSLRSFWKAFNTDSKHRFAQAKAQIQIKVTKLNTISERPRKYISYWILEIKLLLNKKVLLRERERHTACRVASTCYAALVKGTPHSGIRHGWGVPPSQVGGTSFPGGGTPFPGRGYPLPRWGTPGPWKGVPLPGPGKGYPPSTWTWEGGTPPQWWTK